MYFCLKWTISENSLDIRLTDRNVSLWVLHYNDSLQGPYLLNTLYNAFIKQDIVMKESKSTVNTFLAISTTISNLVLYFNTSNQTWDMLGNMMSSRVYHDLSLVPVMTIMDFCKYIFMVNWVVYLCEVQRGKTSKFTQ